MVMKDHDLDVEFDQITVTPEDVDSARIVVCEQARDRTEAATFLAMLGIASVPAWNMGVAG